MGNTFQLVYSTLKLAKKIYWYGFQILFGWNRLNLYTIKRNKAKQVQLQPLDISLKQLFIEVWCYICAKLIHGIYYNIPREMLCKTFCLLSLQEKALASPSNRAF